MVHNPIRSRAVLYLVPALMAGGVATGLSLSLPIVEGAFAPALAQERIAGLAEFRLALQPYGHWEHHARWGDVWVPANRSRDWRPYTVGHWAYTDDWGWYWIADQEEDAWGWVVYHYGHWVLDADFGWVWVPGTEWGPGWVQWRRGTQYVGWAPLPPDEVITVFADEPRFWIFVPIRDFVAPRLASVIVPVREYDALIRETVVENRTVELRDQRIAVNPGVAPDIIAAAVGHPLRSYEVRPRVLAGTARLPGAVEVRAQDIERQRGQALPRETIRETQSEIRPTTRISEPQPLGEREPGRLGSNPPRAARGGNLGAGQTTTGQGRPPPDRRPGENAQQPLSRPGTQGLAPRDQQQEQQRAAPQPERRQPPSTQGLAPREQQQEQQRAAPQPERRQPPSTQGLAPRDQQQEQQRAVPQPERRQPPTTQGLGGRDIPQPQTRAPQEQPRTEGRGGAPRRPGGLE